MEKDNNTFVFEYHYASCGRTRGFSVLDTEGNRVGVVWSHRHKAGEQSAGQAEIRFFDEYKDIYHTWRLVFVNGTRFSFTTLEQTLREKGRFTLTIDPWQGRGKKKG